MDKLFLVSYDLRIPGQDYPNLITAIKALNGQQALRSQWVVKVGANNTAKDVRDHLVKFIDTNDRLLVNDYTDWASWNLMLDLNKVAA